MFRKKKTPTGMTGGKPRSKAKLWTLDKADAEFSAYIRERDNHTCVRCGKKYLKIDFEKRQRGLTNSHFWVRQHKSVRFDPENCDSLCWRPCHSQHWEKEKQGEYKDFKMKQLGKSRYKALERRARAVCPQDRAIIACMVLLGALS